MVKWTDSPVVDDGIGERLPFRRRLRTALEDHGGDVDSLLGLARGLLAIGSVVGILVVAMSFVDGSSEIVAALKAPTFAKLPEIIRPADPVPRPPNVIGLEVSPFTPAIAFVQRFSSQMGSVEGTCDDLSAIGFSDAKWAPSPVFTGEWECASPLMSPDGSREIAFIVIRGSDENTRRSVMLKLNPTSPEDRSVLVDKTKGALLASGMLPTLAAYAGIEALEPGEFPAAGGRLRIIAEHGQPDRRIVTLSLSKPLPLPEPSETCRTDCLQWTAVMPSRKTVQVVER